MAVALTWEPAADLDLHVIEPDGRRCCYRSMRTRSGGALNRDDRKGPGPEIYSTGPNPAAGQYQVQVCYFADVQRHGQPVTATVRVYPASTDGQLPAPIGTFTLVLPQPSRKSCLPVVTFALPGPTITDVGPGVSQTAEGEAPPGGPAQPEGPNPPGGPAQPGGDQPPPGAQTPPGGQIPIGGGGTVPVPGR